MSSLKDLASLIMVPSLVKDGRLDTVKPLGNSIIHPDATGNNDGTDGSTPAEGNFTFSRGSNLAATRVDVNGLIEKGRENEALHSNSFNSWVQTSVSLTSNQSGYDGSSDAWLIESSATNGAAYINRNHTHSGVFTISVYAKKGTSNWLALATTGSHFAHFDLENGVVGVATGANIIDHKIQSVGSGWYRCSMTSRGFSNYYVFIANGDDDRNTNTGDNIYIQDFQLEAGLVATDYIETGASTAQAGILEDLPRLDYSGGASCPSLLLEPQRSNLITQSEYFGAWIETRTTADANQLVSPDGNLNAYKLSETSASGLHAISINTPVVNGTTYNVSVFAKKGSSDFIQILFGTNNVSGNPYANFDLNEGTFQNNGISSVKIENYGNGWYRCSGTIVISGGTTLTYYLAKVNSLSATRASGFAGNVNNNVYLYGATLEAGSYPTSYIPTYGSAVTRSNDSALGQSISLGNSHTIFFNGELNTIDNNKVFMELITSGGSTSATIRNVIGTLRLYNQIDGNYPLGGIQSTNNKWVMRIDGNAYTLFYNNAGSPASQSGAFATARDMDRMNLKGAFTECATKQVLAFNTALTDSECIALTTI